MSGQQRDDQSQNHVSTMAVPWDSYVPRVTECPVYCQSVQAYLSPGTHVLFLVKETSDMVQKGGMIIGTRRKEEGSVLEINVLDPLAGQDCQFLRSLILRGTTLLKLYRLRPVSGLIRIKSETSPLFSSKVHSQRTIQPMGVRELQMSS